MGQGTQHACNFLSSWSGCKLPIRGSTLCGPWAALERTLFGSPESQACIDSLIEFIHSFRMVDILKKSHVYSLCGLQMAFLDFKDLSASEAFSAEKKEQAEEFRSDKGEFPQIWMDINLTSPPSSCNLPLPQPVVLSSCQQLPPALISSISMHILCSQRSVQASSVSFSAVVSAQSCILSATRNIVSPCFFIFLLSNLTLRERLINQWLRRTF